MNQAILTGLVLICGAATLAHRGVPRTSCTKETTEHAATGVPQVTNRPLDVAIMGHGYLQVQVPNSDTGSFTAFTRSGQLTLDADGLLVLSRMTDVRIEPALVIPHDATSIIVASDGGVYVTIAGEAQCQCVGQLELTNFEHTDGLLPLGSNLFVETPACGSSTRSQPGRENLGMMMQGILECSSERTEPHAADASLPDSTTR